MEQRETLFNSEEMQSPFEAIKEVENVSVLFSNENFWLSQQRMATSCPMLEASAVKRLRQRLASA